MFDRVAGAYLVWILGRFHVATCMVLVLGCMACRTARTADPSEAASVSTVSRAVQVYSVAGIVREIPTDLRSLTVRHEAIPGYMPAMTMTLDVRDPDSIKGLLVGDSIRFDLHVTLEESWIGGIQRSPRGPASAAAVETRPTNSLLRVGRIRVGEVLPDQPLLDEDGKWISFSEFSGSAMALTFVFTRCPLPNFCPRMSNHFQRARELLLSESGGPTNWQFLTISFDPEFDSAAVLRQYASRYRGGNPDRWRFASADTHVMVNLSSQLDFRFMSEGGGFVHNLRTVVFDPRGRIHRQFDGNAWKPEDLARCMVEAAVVGGTELVPGAQP